MNLKSTNNKEQKKKKNLITSRIKNFCSMKVTLDCTHSHMTFWGNLTHIKEQYAENSSKSTGTKKSPDGKRTECLIRHFTGQEIHKVRKQRKRLQIVLIRSIIGGQLMDFKLK